MKSKRWSYSRWSMFDKCPKQYNHFYILKDVERTTSAALERGLDIHKKAENYVNGIIKGLPNELYRFRKEFKALRKDYELGKGFTEPDISFNSLLKWSNKSRTDYFIGFADYLHFDGDHCTIIDYKTGKKYPSHRDQGHVYAMACMLIESQIQQIEVEFWYLDSGETASWLYVREDFEKMFKVWQKRVDRMHSAKVFPKGKDPFCNWCDVKKQGKCDGK